MIPLPCLPVDSATSCSSQAANSAMSGEAMIASLSRPAFAAAAMIVPSTMPGLSAGVALAAQDCTIVLAARRNAATSSPIAAAEAFRLGHALQRRAGIGDGDEMPTRRGGADHVFDAGEEIILEDGGFER